MNPQQLREAGDWINEVKKILAQGPARNRDVGKRPDRAHRSTKAAVNLLLSNVRKGAGKTQDTDTTEDDIKKVIFNAVDTLLRTRRPSQKQERPNLRL